MRAPVRGPVLGHAEVHLDGLVRHAARVEAHRVVLAEKDGTGVSAVGGREHAVCGHDLAAGQPDAADRTALGLEALDLRAVADLPAKLEKAPLDGAAEGEPAGARDAGHPAVRVGDREEDGEDGHVRAAEVDEVVEHLPAEWIPSRALN